MITDKADIELNDPNIAEKWVKLNIEPLIIKAIHKGNVHIVYESKLPTYIGMVINVLRDADYKVTVKTYSLDIAWGELVDKKPITHWTGRGYKCIR